VNERALFVLGVALTCACTSEPHAPETRETNSFATSYTQSPHDFCPSEGCGTNSPDISLGLDLRGRVDDAQFWFGGAFITEAGVRRPADFTIAGDGIQIGGDPGLFRYEDVNPYTDTRLILSIKRDTGAEYELKLVRQGGADYHASPYGWVHAYQLSVRKTAQGSEAAGLTLGEVSPFCLGTATDPGVDTPPESVWAFFFAGDRYDGVHKRVLPGESTRFHIACSESALAKLLLFRHTEVGATRPATAQNVTLAQRQALLKLLTADHCGDGHSFTTRGQLINFAIANNSWKGLHAPETPLDLTDTEAIWGPDGVVCLNEPRAGTRAEIAAHCESVGRTIPRCTPEQTRWDGWKALGHAISVHLTAPQ
jgi:hypothetical protein